MASRSFYQDVGFFLVGYSARYNYDVSSSKHRVRLAAREPTICMIIGRGDE
jgi:hypothetical protein